MNGGYVIVDCNGADVMEGGTIPNIRDTLNEILYLGKPIYLSNLRYAVKSGGGEEVKVYMTPLPAFLHLGSEEGELYLVNHYNEFAVGNNRIDPII